MSDQIVSIFKFLEDSLGMHPATVAANALLLAVLLVFLAVFLLVRLRRARKIVHALAERLGYEPPYGDGKEILELEIEKETVERDRDKIIEQLEQRVRGLDADGEDKLVELTALHRRSKELEEQLQQANFRHDEVTAQSREQALTHEKAVEQLELRMRNAETESNANLATAQQRAKELEDKLQQANLWSDKVTALANDQAQAHQKAQEQIEQRMRDKEAEHIADLTASQRRSKDLEDQLQAAALENDRAIAQAREQAQTHQVTVSQFEERIRQMETEGNAFVSALERRSKELEEQLHQAFFRNDQLSAQAEEQAQAHRIAVEHLEQRLRDMVAESNAYLAPLQERSKELEEQLQRAAVRHERVTAETAEQMQAYRTTVETLEQRMRENETEGVLAMSALQERSKELEDQLQRAHILNEKLSAQAGEQAQAHLAAVEQLEQRMRKMESEGDANMTALHQRSKDLEAQLQEAAARHEGVRVQAGEREQAHRMTVEQLEERLREIETAGAASLTAAQERSNRLEDQLQQASLQNDHLTAQVREQVQTHQAAVEQLEQRLREMEAASAADTTAAEQRSKYLEDQLHGALLKSESEKVSAHQEALDRAANVERLELRIRGLESEKDARESHVKTLEEHVKGLEDQLQQAANRAPVERAGIAANASEQFMRRAEWITACAVGTILPYGLVAAEAYASAALVADPQSADAPQLLAELARIHRAYPEGLPSVVEAVTTFDERTAAFFATHLDRAADIAEDEAHRRYRAGLNRSALLVANVALELRLKTEGENGPGAQRLREMKETLAARLGVTAKA